MRNRLRLKTLILRQYLPCLIGLLASLSLQALKADDLQWAKPYQAPVLETPPGLRNSLSIHVLSALDGLFELRYQRSLNSSLAFYQKAIVGSNEFYPYGMLESYKGTNYKRFQVGLETGVSGITLSPYNTRVHQQDLWGNGLLLESGLRVMYTNIREGFTYDILSFGILSSLGWQIQYHNFAISLFIDVRLLGHIGLTGAVPSDFPSFDQRTSALKIIPSLPFINQSVASNFASDLVYTFSQRLTLRFSFFF